MRKKDEEVIKKVVDKIIDSKVLLTGDGDFYVSDYMGEIANIVIRNLFSSESSINEIYIGLHGSGFIFENGKSLERAVPSYAFTLSKKAVPGETLIQRICFEVSNSNLSKSPSFMRLVEYIEENKHLIFHNDKEYGKSHTLTDTDFI